MRMTHVFDPAPVVEARPDHCLRRFQVQNPARAGGCGQSAAGSGSLQFSGREFGGRGEDMIAERD